MDQRSTPEDTSAAPVSIDDLQSTESTVVASDSDGCTERCRFSSVEGIRLVEMPLLAAVVES